MLQLLCTGPCPAADTERVLLEPSLKPDQLGRRHACKCNRIVEFRLLSLQVVAATRWKRDMGLYGKGKEGSRQLALALFPQAAEQLKCVASLQISPLNICWEPLPTRSMSCAQVLRNAH